MNKISKFFLNLIGIVIIVFLLCKLYEEDANPYNFEDLKTEYKNYILVDKMFIGPDTYIFKLKNPCNGDIRKVRVKWYLYRRVYYVGDTIK